MKLETAKLELLERIETLNDLSLVKELTFLLNEKQKKEKDYWDKYLDNFKKEIEASIADLDQGNGISDEEVMKKYDDWLKKNLVIC